MEHATDKLELDDCPHCPGWVARIGDTELEDDCPLTACWRALKQHNGSNPMSNLDKLKDEDVEKCRKLALAVMMPPELFGMKAMHEHQRRVWGLAKEVLEAISEAEGKPLNLNSEGATS